MIFDCYGVLFDGGKCEWQAIRGFVAVFNAATGSKYQRSECLDVKHRNSKQPEVLLKCAGLPDTVIERKTVVWPPEYIRNHRKFHYLGEELSRCFGSRFRVRPHLLRIEEQGLYREKNCKQVVNKICEAIERGDVQGKDPFAWHFCPVNAWQDGWGRVEGIGLEGCCRYSPSWDDPADLKAARRKAIQGFRERCQEALTGASQKFEGYKDARHIILLQFIGNDEFLLEEDVEGIVESTTPGGSCDEVWVAFHDWRNECEYNVGWRRLWRKFDR